MTGKRLLIVDDEPDFGEFVRKVAEDLGYEVTVTTEGRAFKKIYDKCDPTVVLLDMIMPETDGIELVTWLAKNHCTAKVIVATGYHPDYGLMAQKLGEDGGIDSVTLLTKPVSPAQLRAAL